MSSTVDLVSGSVAELPEKKPSLATFKSLTLRQKITYILDFITIEPILICYILSAIICYPALSNLELEKACRVNLALNGTICDLIISGAEHNFTTEHNSVQAVVSNMHSWQGPLQTFMPLVLILFIGSFSDRHKWRKPFFLLPIFGELFAVLGCILCVFYIDQWPVEVQGVLQQVVPSLCGGQVMLIMACYSYVADVSSLEMRTLRVGAVQVSLNLAIPIGQFLSGILFASIGYYGVLGIAACLFTFAILHGIFWVKEDAPKNLAGNGLLKDLFDPKHALETINVMVKKTPGKNRLIIVLLFVLMAVYAIVAVGESSLFYLYVTKVFKWTPVDYGFYSTTSTLIHLFGTLVGVPLMSKVFGLNDFVILTLTMMDFVVANVVFGLANSNAMLYVACVCGIITGITVIGIRSSATKVVSSSDFAKAQSLFGIAETLGPLVGIPLYNMLYVGTIETFPNAYFFFGSILYAFLIPIVIYMMMQSKKELNLETKDDITDPNNIKLEEHQTTHM